MRWDDLSMREKSDLMKIFIKSGVTSLDTMKEQYEHSFGEGGDTRNIPPREYVYHLPTFMREDKHIEVTPSEETINRVNSSNANFVRRLKDTNRQTIPDWEVPGNVATHKLSVEFDQNMNPIIFPKVQERNGKLVDYTRPPYHSWAGQNEAISSGDIVRVNTIDEGVAFTRGYKNLYPAFNTHGNGGRLKHSFDEGRYLGHFFNFGGNIEENTEEGFGTIMNNIQNLTKNPVEAPELDSYVLKPEEQNATQEVEKAKVESKEKYKVLERNQSAYIKQKVNELYSSKDYSRKLEDNLKGMSKEELIEVQKKIADSGFYDYSIANESRQSIRNKQRLLVRKGYLKPKEGRAASSEIDGIAGVKTNDAWKRYNRDRNIDGILGKRTVRGYKKLFNNEDPWNKECSTRGVDGCAQWVTKKYESAVGLKSLQDGVISNAWQMPMNIANNGGEIIYNIYDNSFNRIKNATALKTQTEKALAKNPIDYSKLQVGDVVGIYLPSSNMHTVALKDGTTKNTHVGIVTGFDSSGMPIVEHNIHGSHRKDRADRLTGSRYGRARIAVASRPRGRVQNLKQLVFTPKESKYEIDDKYANEDLTMFMNSMAGAADQIGYIFPDANMDEVQQIAIGVLKRETSFMTNKVSDQGGLSRVKNEARKIFKPLKTVNLDKLSRIIKEFGSDLFNFEDDKSTGYVVKHAGKQIISELKRSKKEADESKSSNLTKFKLSSLNEGERNLLGIHTPEDLENPEKAGVASLFILSKNYDYFKRLQKEYPDLNISNDDIKALVALSYNQGMGKLYHIGFDNKTGKAAPEELEEIRKRKSMDYKVRDISATNYKYARYINENLPDLLYDSPIIGGKDRESYIATALNAIEKYVHKKK